MTLLVPGGRRALGPSAATCADVPGAAGTVDATDAARPRRRGWRAAVRRANPLWWVTPAGSVVLVVPLSLVVAVQIPDFDYRLFYKVPRVISAGQAELFIAAAAVLVLGTLVPMAHRMVAVRPDWPTLPGPQLRVLRTAERVAFALTILGYVLLAGIGAARGASPSLLISAIASQSNYSGTLKNVFAPVAGVTSLTQIGIAYVVICGLLLCHGRSGRLVRRLIIVLVLGLLRSYLLTERLALLELLVPLAAIGASWLRRQPRRGRWLTAAPLFAVPLLLVVFGAFEYSRSWQYYKTRTDQSFPLFVVNRLAGYYATSYNNGALQLDHLEPGRLPYSSIEFLWTAPGPAQLGLYDKLAGQNGPDLLNQVLTQYGNPEFNNPGGLAVPYVDFGVVGGLIFFAVAGLLIGFAYRSWRSGAPAGLLIYPVLFTGLLELPRYLYWTQGRVFPPLVFLGLTAWLMTRASKPALRRRARPHRRTVEDGTAVAAG